MKSFINFIKFIVPHFAKDLVFCKIHYIDKDNLQIEPVGSAVMDPFGNYTKNGITPDVIVSVNTFTWFNQAIILTNVSDIDLPNAIDFKKWHRKLLTDKG